MEKPKPPCELNSIDECTTKSALACLGIVKNIKHNDDDLPRVVGQSQFELQESVNTQRDKLEKCLMERFLSGQFGAPKGLSKGPLRR